MSDYESILLTVDDAVAILGLSRTTGFRQWVYARAFLQAELQVS